MSDGSARLSRPLVHALFFASGAAALLYQVLWVREFGNRFGNGVWSTALVTALFMAGLGVGGRLGGRVADRRPSPRRRRRTQEKIDRHDPPRARCMHGMQHSGTVSGIA